MAAGYPASAITIYAVLAGRGADGGLMGHFLGMCNVVPGFYVSTSKSIIKALINMHSFEIQLSPIG
ncbi:hypothetical protein J0085_002413 [Salmonella enterica subsp. enterica serovar Newport]|nr:hypothetical protein [Salmonella enterica subsp. enterica serovar Newport]